MTPSSRNGLRYTWLALVLATGMSWWLGTRASQAFTLTVLVIALIKCRLVMRNYMEVKHAPRWLQRACDGWLALNAAMLFAFYSAH